MPDYHIPLLPSRFYHIFNRAVGNEKAFLSADNYWFFLSKIKKYIIPVAEVYAYSLLPNHFHLLIKIKEADSIKQYFETTKGKPFNETKITVSDVAMQSFSNLMNSYTKAFNKVYRRKGSLFIDHLKRSEAKTDSDVNAFIFYVHKNAVHHGLCKKIGEWKYDSYNSILSEKPTLPAREKIFEWFGSKELFVDFHHL